MLCEHRLVQRNSYRLGSETDLVSNIGSIKLLVLTLRGKFLKFSKSQFLYLKI